jgi:hypothetical protein
MTSLVRWPIWMCLLLLLAACGDDGGGGGTITPPPTPAVNRAPVITSAASVSVPENTTGDFFQVAASDPDGDTLTYSLSGTDAALFAISTAGKISFLAPPDFEKPADANHDNVYELQVTVSDGKLQAQAPLTVTVTNVLDQTVATQVGAFYKTPVQVTAVPGQKLVFVAQQNGQIYLVDPATNDMGSLYLTVPNGAGLPNTGIVSAVAAPDFASSGFLYVMAVDGNTLRVVRYGRLNAAQADPASAVTILSVSLPLGYRGGWIGFGPNNLLYVALGDGDAANNAGNLLSLLGKVLRVDPSRDDFPGDAQRNYGIPADNPFVGGGALPEIYAYGFQGPTGGSFDGDTLYLGDRPQAPSVPARIDLIRPQDAGHGYNQAGAIGPIISVDPFTISGGASAVGGFVYSGPSPQLAGQYVFFASGRTAQGIYGLPATQLIQGTTREAGQGTKIADLNATSFGLDSDRNLYVTTNDGKLYVFRVS